MTLKYNPVRRKKQSSIITIISTLTTIGINNLTSIIIIITDYVIIITTMASRGSPGTVSGNVSFCIVCIAFRALRARYHLDKNTAA